MRVERDEMPKPLAARIDDEDLLPQEAPLPHPVPVVEPPWAQAYPWPALSESGCSDNIQGSFLGSFGDAVLQE